MQLTPVSDEQLAMDDYGRNRKGHHLGYEGPS